MALPRGDEGWSAMFDCDFPGHVLRGSSSWLEPYRGLFERDLRNEFDFWKVHGIMNTSGLLQSNCYLIILSHNKESLVHMKMHLSP